MFYSVMSFVSVQETRRHVIWTFQLVCQNSRTSPLFCLIRGNCSALTQWKNQHPIFVTPTQSCRTRDKWSVSIVLSRCSSPTGKKRYCTTCIMQCLHQLGIKPMGKQQPHCSCNKEWKQWARGTPEDVTGTWWAKPDLASATAGAP